MSNSLETKAKTSSSNPKFIDTTAIPQNPGSSTSIASLFQGPIPPPIHLEQYEKLVPGSAQRFLNEPHLEAEHRRALEKYLISEQLKLSKRGQVMAFSLALLCITAAFAAIFRGYDLAGLGALFLSVVPFLGVFLYAKTKNRSS